MKPARKSESDPLTAIAPWWWPVLALVLIWPAMLNGSPFYFGDSPGYVRGGALAINFAWDVLSGPFGTSPETGNGEAGPTVYGTRSVAFSLYAYLSSAPALSGWLGIYLQAIIAVALILKCCAAFGLPLRAKGAVAFIGTLAVLTPLPWHVSFIMPDVFAGFGLLAILLLTCKPDALSLVWKLALGALISFTVAAHLSHVPIFGLLTAAAGLALFAQARWRVTTSLVRQFAWIGGPALLGLVATITLNAVGFDAPSVSGKRYPILLASSIEDGPARWYLTEQCKARRYTVCDVFPEGLPETANAFLWGEDGVRKRATPEQLDRIRAEEGEILREATRAYPGHAIRAALLATGHQLISFGLNDHHFDHALNGQPPATLDIVDTGAEPEALKSIFEALFGVAAIASLLALIWLALRHRHALTEADRTAMGLVLITALTNAAICGALSDVTDRYQGRIIWVFVLVVLILAVRIRPISRRT